MRRRIGEYALLSRWCENECFIQNRLSDDLRSFHVEDERAVGPDFVGEAAAQSVAHAELRLSMPFHCKSAPRLATTVRGTRLAQDHGLYELRADGFMAAVT